MNYEINPFESTKCDRWDIWEMLVRRDIDAFLAQDWNMVKGDFAPDRFFGLHAHGLSNPDSWRMGYPDLAAYRDDWLKQAAESAACEYAEPLRAAMFRATVLRDIDFGENTAIVHKKFDGVVAKSDGTNEILNWQTLYFCARLSGSWKITSFIGYLPNPLV